MANARFLNEYLVALGLKDNMSPQLTRTLRRSEASIKKFAGGVTKAGLGISAILLAANGGIARFVTGLVNTDDRVKRLANDMGKTHEEAKRLDFALRAMNRSLEEIEGSEELTRQFEKIKKDAESIAIPDMSKGLTQVRAIQSEFASLRNTMSHGIQWVGHHLLKYLYNPMNKLRDVFANINTRIIEGMPEWSRRIASVMASVVRMTAAIIRVANNIFRAIKRIFDMIPTEIKILTGILAGLAAFIRAGPLGKLMMVFTILMLLVEDFFTYLDGGQSALGGLWRFLIDLWDTLNKGGGFIEKLKTIFLSALQSIRQMILRVVDVIRGFWDQLRNSNVIDNFRNAFQKAGDAIKSIFEMLGVIVNILFGTFLDGAEGMTPFFVWLISDALPKTIGLISNIARVVADAISWFLQLNGVAEVIRIVAAAIAAIIIAKKAWAIAQGILNAVMALNPITWIIAAIVALIAIIFLLVKNWESVANFFRGLWDRITGFFRRGIDRIIGFFRGIINWIKDNFKSIIAFIINPFAGIFSFLYNNFEGFRNFVDNVVQSVKNFFLGLWNRIVEIFNGVKDFFTGIFQGAFEAITSIFSRITDFFKGLWDGVTNGVRAFVDRVLKFLNPVKRLVEGVGRVVGRIFGRNNSDNAEDELPAHAQGGIFTKPHVAEFAEDGPEAIVPLSKPQRAREVLGGVANFLNHGRNAMRNLDSGISAQSQQVASYATANTYNTYTITMPSNYNINDTSGRPESVARAVQQKEQLKMRNLQGVLNTY